ncbi:aminoglycoside 3'-phosphotransferase/choline kinase family protein [Actinoplanes sp. NEAU-A12]|uniref:Aminoglycoside 3'-phosphotransferase/choline kinase family protein n=1 Tax=Actinoplanes sandaracinus TaxID=3045177 RepID=A0ABT6WBN3_9ACTN|nr:aminoglycoside 3'-phosphotransferase/choline kinase family protein [Actinoplanes sandaracinus]MDI6097133.1 aminoglycoside 3'-phosphotransferase/choline kinase family protein [Actinoplanes sandaracinus]
MRLPVANSVEAFGALDEVALRPGAEALLHDLGVDAATAERFTTGSLPVYRAGDLVLKLFPQVHVDEHPVETAVLQAVHGRLPIPTPRVVGSGERDGWGYVLMSRMPGVPLTEAWNDIPAAGRDRLADDLGQAVAALHALPPPAIDDWWPRDWDAFVAGQRTGCVERQRDRGLAPEWLEQIPAALDVDLTDSRRVLLHTEIMRDHLLVSPEGGWHFSGLIDFEPAMRGAAEYEFVGVGCFVAEGDARFLGRFLRAYGHPADTGFPRRMMAWSLLHYYSNLPAWMRRLPGPARPTFDDLADRWFGTA